MNSAPWAIVNFQIADWFEECGVILVDRLQIVHKLCFSHSWVRQSNPSLTVLGPFLVHELQRVDGGCRNGIVDLIG